MTDRNWFREYCEKSTACCMEYFVVERRAFIELVFWVLSFLLMVWLTFSAINVLIDVWINNPTLVFIENTESGIDEIPFPRIMFCPSHQIRKSVWERHKNTNSSYWRYLQEYQSVACSMNTYAEQSNVIPRKYISYETIKSLANDCAISCSELFQSMDVKWQNVTIKNFCNLIQPIMSIVGKCFIFNMMPLSQLFHDKYYQRYMDFFPKNSTFNPTVRSKWNLDHGYASYQNDNVYNVQEDVIPIRTGGVSYYHRLKIRLNAMNDDFVGCPDQRFMEGYVMSIYTNPVDYYSVSARSFIVPEQYMKVQITPYVKKINSNLLWRSPEVRKCYLHGERKLSIFQHYTEDNCYLECTMNETISTCGCVNFDMVFLAARGANICGPASRECVIRAEQATYHDPLQAVCNCWPSCTVIGYEITHTTLDDDWAYLKTTGEVKNNSRGATIEVIFKNPYFTALQAQSILGIDSLISVVGGLLGLFLGINVINVFELLYVIIETVFHYISRMCYK